MAIWQRRPQEVVHHSDQGSQYTSIAFGARCREAGVRPSTGSVGDAYDNALCESFFATLECELLDRRSFALTPRRAWRSSSSWKASIIGAAATRHWATSHRPPSRTTRARRQHEHTGIGEPRRPTPPFNTDSRSEGSSPSERAS